MENGKLVALEVEKKAHYSAVSRKMKMYTQIKLDHHGYDKVILVWYSLEGKRLKEWIYEKGTWRTYERPKE
jgi:hypothetical protein